MRDHPYNIVDFLLPWIAFQKALLMAFRCDSNKVQIGKEHT